MRQLKNPIFLYGLGFLLLLTVFGIIFMPIVHLSAHFLPQVTFVGIKGNLTHGRWQRLIIKGQALPLSCQYKHQRLLDYHLQCDKPMRINITATIGLTGKLTLHDSRITGSLEQTTAWLRFLNIPPAITENIAGRVDIHLDRLVFAHQNIEYINMSGHVDDISLEKHILIDKAELSTLSPSQQNQQPIRIEMKTPDSKTNEDSSTTHLYLLAQIQNNRYQTTGEIRGSALQPYQLALQFFGRQIGNNHFQINMKGKLL